MKSLGLGIQHRRKIGKGYDFLLDTYSGAAYAYSFFKLNSAYSGFCCRIRNGFTNVETDIGFSGNYVNEAAILAACGVQFGFVVRWYDQSGNGVDKIQTVDSLQPVICFSGAITKADGFVSMRSNVDTYGAKGLINTVTGGGSASMAFNVMKIGIGSECLPATNQSPVKFYGVMQPNLSSPTSAAGTPLYYKNGAVFSSPTRADLQTAFNNDLAVLTTYEADLSTWTDSGSLYPSYRGIDGNNLEEIVYFTSSVSARAGVEQNIIDRYAI